MRAWFLVALGVVLAPNAAVAQPKPEVIKREQSKLWLEDVPGMPNAQTIYVYSGWTPNYSAERFYTQAIPPGAALPRLQVNLALLAPGFVWMADSALGEKYVKGWPFFKDREVTMLREHGGGSSGTITVPFRSGEANCFAFLIRNVSIGLIEGSGSGGRPSVDGIYCGTPGSALDAAQMQNVMASIRVTEDPSRVRTPLVRPAATTPLASPPHIAAPAAAVNPALIGWSAAPGTRFVASSGYFQITRIEGTTAITVNAGNRTDRWVAGLLVPRNAARIDSQALAPLLPLAVGKEVSFEERGNGDDRWQYTVRVERRETLTLKERSYDTFVIAVRDRSVNPEQGGLDRTRTIWVSPGAGGILRYRTRQDSGPPAPSFNFEIVDIIPAGSGS